MKRLLLFRPSLGDGGADRVTITLLKSLDRRLFTPTLVLVRKQGALVNEIPMDVPVIDLAARRLATSAPALARAIRAVDPDIIFSTSSGANTIAVVARVLARSRARLVLSERNAVVRETFSRARTLRDLLVKRIAYRHADAIASVSDGVTEDLVRRLGLPPERVHTVWNPLIDDSVLARANEPVEHPWFAGPEPVLVACGRLVEQKDYPTMLRAFRIVRDRHPAKLVVLGDGPLRPELEGMVVTLGLAEHVAFIGFHANPFKYMARGAVFVQSSRAEGLPGTLVQSMAVGTPVVATDCDFGPREVVSSGTDGWLVPVGDADRLALHIGELLSDRTRRDEFSARARAVAQRFAIADAVARYERALLGEVESRA